MMDIRALCVGPDNTIRDVMSTIDRNAKGIALLVDQGRHLVGTITDGDIRRAILAGISLDASAYELLEHKKSDPRCHEPITAPVGTSDVELLRLMRQYTVHQIPLLDEARRVVELAEIDRIVGEERLPLQAVVMAGGFGTRLRPLTEELPKPMLPVGDRPLLELIVDGLRQAGVHRVHVTTHYMSEKIRQHFGDGSEFGVDMRYVSEEKPLGTAGALSLMERPEEPLLVINGDILTRVDFRALLAFHQEHAADLTVGVRQYEFQVPYGVLECDGPSVRRVSEKPIYTFFVNAGIYLLNPSVHEHIPQDCRFDMTDLIERLTSTDHTVVSFPVVEYWLDIGQLDDYEKAQEDYLNGRFTS
jgi:dTDP-glucose pyrophosphorylase